MNVMITGAAGGLGRAMAVECAKRGYSLFLTDLDAEGLEAIREGLSRRFRIRIHAKACDLTDSAGVDALMAHASRLGLTFDMLLNVAGVDFEGGFLKRKREKVMRIVALNNEGTLRITHAVLQRRTPNRRFTVVLVSKPRIPVPHAAEGHLRRLQALLAGFRTGPAGKAALYSRRF